MSQKLKVFSPCKGFIAYGGSLVNVNNIIRAESFGKDSFYIYLSNEEELLISDSINNLIKAIDKAKE